MKNKTKKEKFLTNESSVLRHYFLENCTKFLKKSEIDTLAEAEEWDIKMTINGIEISMGVLDNIINKTYNQQKDCLLGEYIQENATKSSYNQLMSALAKLDEVTESYNLALDKVISELSELGKETK